MNEQVVGVDISKLHFDAHILPDARFERFENSKTGFRKFAKWLNNKQIKLIVFEPTGPYHRPFEAYVHDSGFPLAKVNPRYARRFAEASGRLNKTDKVDAEMLAHMGMALEPAPQKARSESLISLMDLFTARRSLMKDRTANLNRQKNLRHPLLKRQCAARIRQLEKQVEVIEQELMETINGDDELRKRFDVLVSIPGISFTTAVSLIVELPELGSLSSGQAASLAGLAPMHRESGTWKGKSRIRGGRAVLRQSLYLPALVATRFNPDLRRVYLRLIESGKPAKVAITAVMRKLVVLANALIAAERRWEPRASIDNHS